MHLKNIASSFCGACLLVISSMSVHAAEPSSVPQVEVRYDDLNVSNPSGARTLLLRLQAATRQVCGTSPRITELRYYADFRTCVRESLDQAVRQVDARMLTSLYRQSASLRP